MKALVLDSGILINLSMNGLLYILESLKSQFQGKILITNQVKYETVDRPINISRFELGALRIKNLIEKGILEMPDSLGIDEKIINEKTKELMDLSNHFLQANGHWINIVSDAEMSCLALSDELTEKGVENIIGIDERTTRILGEKPGNLERIMSEKLHQRVSLVASNFSIFKKYKFVRSSEIVYVAYKKNLINLEGNKILEALLFATKFKGSSISFEEINKLKKL